MSSVYTDTIYHLLFWLKHSKDMSCVASVYTDAIQLALATQHLLVSVPRVAGQEQSIAPRLAYRGVAEEAVEL